MPASSNARNAGHTAVLVAMFARQVADSGGKRDEIGTRRQAVGSVIEKRAPGGKVPEAPDVLVMPTTNLYQCPAVTVTVPRAALVMVVLFVRYCS